MSDHSAKRDAIARNYEAFEAMLPVLLAERRDQFALMRDGAVAGFFPSAGEAQQAGSAQFSDGLFSVQRVEDKVIDLGFYSYARYRRVS